MWPISQSAYGPHIFSHAYAVLELIVPIPGSPAILHATRSNEVFLRGGSEKKAQLYGDAKRNTSEDQQEADYDMIALVRRGPSPFNTE